jgi:hypothetical protein
VRWARRRLQVGSDRKLPTDHVGLDGRGPACGGVAGPHLHPFVAESPPAVIVRLLGRPTRPTPHRNPSPRPSTRPVPDAILRARASPPAPAARCGLREARVAAGRSAGVPPAPAAARSIPPRPELGGGPVNARPANSRPSRAGIRAVEARAGRRGCACSAAVEGVVGAAAALDTGVGRCGGSGRRMRALACR